MDSKKILLSAAIALAMGCAAQSAQAGDPCYYSGTKFSDGGASCQSGREYRCDDGEWLTTTRACDFESPDVASAKNCQFAGISFSPGSASCQAGQQFRCETTGEWSSLRIPCTAGDAPIRVVPSGDTCMFSGATVASGSTICQSGSTFLCNNGQWTNLGTVCR